MRGRIVNASVSPVATAPPRALHHLPLPRGSVPHYVRGARAVWYGAGWSGVARRGGLKMRLTASRRHPTTPMRRLPNSS